VEGLPLAEGLRGGVLVAQSDSVGFDERHAEGEALPERDDVGLTEGEPLPLGEPDELREAPLTSEREGPPLPLPAEDSEGEQVDDAERLAVGEELLQRDAEPLRLPDGDADGEREGEPVPLGEGDTRAEGELVAEAEEERVRLPATRTALNKSTEGATAKISCASSGTASAAVPLGESKREVAV
jgi:hypothetical protein